jgi:adenosylmethionine-8-amino-7-oxononanoate aminotransferase
VLEIMEREDLVARSAQMGILLRERLAKLEAHPNVAEARGLGLLQAIELVRDKEKLERFSPDEGITRRIQSIALKKGVFVYAAGSGEVRDVLLIGPPFTVTEDEIDTIGSVLEESIDLAVAGR